MNKQFHALRTMTIRQILLQFIAAAYSIMGTYLIWKTVGILANNDSPIVVVLTGSMEPGWQVGDILFLKVGEYQIGDSVVFQFNKNEIPIVHRAIKKYSKRTLTKGDNNRYSDESLYKNGKYMLDPVNIISMVYGNLPFFGKITIWANKHPSFKFVFQSLTALFVFFDRE